MRTVNFTKQVIVIQPDPVKLDDAIRTALAESREVVRKSYLADLEDVPPLSVRVSQGKYADAEKNAAHIVIHLLLPKEDVSLLEGYVEVVDSILSLSKRDCAPEGLLTQLVLGDVEKLQRWVKSEIYRIVLRHAFRAFFVSLLRQRAALLPPSMERYLPVERGVWRGYELMPERLKHMCAVYYAGTGLEFGVDWGLCNYAWKGAGIRNVNRYLQNGLTSQADTLVVGNRRIRVGDPVIVTENSYDLGLFNGTTGILLRISTRYGHASGYFRLDGHKAPVWLTTDELANVGMRVAYAISIHKSQGSEYDAVLVSCVQNSSMLEKSLIYTGLTRSKGLLSIGIEK